MLKFVRALTGESIDLDHTCMQIRNYSTVEWYFPRIANALQWPECYITLMCTSKAGDDILIRQHLRSRTNPSDLRPDEDGSVTIAVKKDPPPDIFSTKMCLCDFGSCCLQCIVPGDVVCIGCGNNGCCRIGSCGHACCEEFVAMAFAGKRPQQLQVCPYSGCLPDWAVKPRTSGQNKRRRPTNFPLEC